MSQEVTISKKEYLRLRIAQMTLQRLEAGGVDNWEWYGDSLNPDGEESLEDLEDKLKKDIEKNEQQSSL